MLFRSSSISTKNGYPITFMDFTKVGFPIMILTVVVATIYMFLRYGLALM